jgi:putative endonuclease
MLQLEWFPLESSLLKNPRGIMATKWFVYIVRCQDQTLYTGITTDLQRLQAHNNGKTGAKYTRARRPVHLVYQEETPCRASASRREHLIKKLTVAQKKALIAAGTGETP